MLNLFAPEIRLLPSYLEFGAAVLAAGDNMWTNMPAPNESPEAFLARVLGEIRPAEGKVPESHYWAVIGEEVVGRIALRHALNENLREFGGHIGYEVKPARRRQGLAKQMLRALLARPETRKLGRVLLTCAPNNIASNKTIVACGGILEKTAWVEKWKRQTNYYWIDLR